MKFYPREIAPLFDGLGTKEVKVSLENRSLSHVLLPPHGDLIGPFQRWEGSLDPSSPLLAPLSSMIGHGVSLPTLTIVQLDNRDTIGKEVKVGAHPTFYDPFSYCRSQGSVFSLQTVSPLSKPFFHFSNPPINLLNPSFITPSPLPLHSPSETSTFRVPPPWRR